MLGMDSLKTRVEKLAELAKEFGLQEASWSGPDGGVTLRKRSARPVAVAAGVAEEHPHEDHFEAPAEEPVAAKPVGNPITSPMTGIYYAAANPSSPPFVKEGDTVTAGQTVGLIEAMKVFNEVPATISGIVLKVVAESGQIVQPGDTLVLIG